MSYWGICIPEILSEHGVDLDEDTLNAIIDDIESCDSVKYEYSPDIGGCNQDEASELKEKIRILEARVPCKECSGRGSKMVQITNCHVSYDDCIHCNGKGWV